MGIHRFYYPWLRHQNFRGVSRRRLPAKICSLLIDMNGIIHRTSHKTYAIRDENQSNRRHNSLEEQQKRMEFQERQDYLRRMATEMWHQGEAVFKTWLAELEKEHFRTITLELTNLLLSIDPQDLLIVSIDGPVPLAKMKQQRSRRYRSDKDRHESTIRNQGGYPWPLFNSNSITPGTNFMFRLDTYLQAWLNEQARNLPSNVIYYSHMVPGEGEHRIMDDIRNGKVESCRSFEGGHVIYGSDSDLVMLATIAPLDRIYIARDDVTDIVSIDNFRQALYSQLKTKTALHDFVVMFYLIGNDFLPATPAMEDINNSVEALISIYQQINGVQNIHIPKDSPDPFQPVDGENPLTNDDPSHSINWESLQVFFDALSQIEETLLDKIAQHPPKYPSRMLTNATITVKSAPQPGQPNTSSSISKTVDYSRFRWFWYSNALLPKTPYQSLSPLEKQLLGDPPEISTNEIANMVYSYLQGIGWVNTYYNQGFGYINMDWFYQWEHPPLLSDIASVIKEVNRIPAYTIQPNQKPLNVVYQLLTVLSPLSKDLLPIQVRSLMEPNSPLIDLYPQTFLTEIDGKMAEWQGMILLPKFQPERIVQVVNDKVKFSTSEINKYKAVGPVRLTRTKETEELMERAAQFEKFRRKHLAPRSRGTPTSRRFQGETNLGRRGRSSYEGRRRGRFSHPGEINRDRRGGYQSRGRDDVERRSRIPSRLTQPSSDRPSLQPRLISVGLGKVPQPIITTVGRIGSVGSAVSRRSFASALMEDLPVQNKPQFKHQPLPKPGSGGYSSNISTDQRGVDDTTITSPNLAALNQLNQQTRTEAEETTVTHHHQSPIEATAYPIRVVKERVHSPNSLGNVVQRRGRFQPRTNQQKRISKWNSREPLM